ncbi:MAG: hypothetical protein Q4D41_00585 [Prevotellaceae bacterium]|nr:hypothetical protein [Prevotellaceae bacterium]
MNQLQQEIHKWGDEAVKSYIEVAKTFKEKEGSAFYTQSPLNIIDENPELVIIGINPGSTGTYKEQLEHQKWKSAGFPSVEGFLKGNVISWHDRDNDWHFWKRIHSILKVANREYLLKDDNKKLVCTNITPFGTKKEKQLQREIIQKTSHHTVELLEILKPKVVLCLGRTTYNELCRFINARDVACVYPSVLSIAFHDDYIIVGIQHPSARYTYEQISLVGESLRQIFDHHGRITAEEIRECNDVKTAYQNYLLRKHTQKNKKMQVSLETIAQLLQEQGFEKIEGSEGKSTYRFRLSDSHPIAITVTNSQSGYIGVRYAKYVGHYHKGNYENEEQIINKLLTLKGYKKADAWFAIKAFSDFETDSEQLINAIVDECILIKNLLEHE